mmetsp:Transcript_18669/g.56376  ORF Transcript_18669/g.56376 Transcript_18669/m.56376 type:complete len:229 (+) Transcript_18669:556-1242(+)
MCTVVHKIIRRRESVMRKHRDAHAHAGIRAGSVVGSSGAPLFVCELEHGCPVAVRQHQFRSEAVLELGRCVEEGLGVACEYAVRARPPSQVEVDHPTIDPRLDETDNELLPPCAATEQLEVPTRHAAIRLVAAVARGQYVRARGVQCRDERRTRIGQEHLGGVTQQHVQAAGHKRRCRHVSLGERALDVPHQPRALPHFCGSCAVDDSSAEVSREKVIGGTVQRVQDG